MTKKLARVSLAAALCSSVSTLALADDVQVQPPSANAQAAPAAPASGAMPSLAPSANPAINLINLLVRRGVISKSEAAALIKQANEDAAKEQAAEAQAAAAQQKAQAAATQANQAQTAASQAQAAATQAQNAADYAQATAASVPKPDAHPDAVRVTYVPEPVKNQLKEEIKQQVLTQARAENWAAPNTFPAWVSHFHPYGDFRFRSEGDFFPSGNDDALGAAPNFNAINTGSPYDIAPLDASTSLEPQRDVNVNRERYRVRARLGAAIDLPDGFSSDFRIATGQDDQPVSENQSIGIANGSQGGNFSKYQIWLDRAYLRYDMNKGSDNNTSFMVGRFDNPYFSTNLIWWEDPIAMDGAMVQDHYNWRPNVNGFFTAGAFPVFNTDFNFASNQPTKFSSEDKWLYAAQAGADWKIDRDYKVKVGSAYYYFQNMEGQVSTPCSVVNSSSICNTDDTRPTFAQNGNTYMALRNIVANAANGFGTTSQYQYFGLATPFHELALTGRLDYSHFDPFHLRLDGEFVENLAFNKKNIQSKVCGAAWAPFYASPYCAGGTLYDGGNSGYLVRLTAGSDQMAKRWDWNVSFGYRYVESDAVVDAFNDPDFGLGGTNLQGYTLIGTMVLAPGIQASLRLFNADAIAGPTYASDVVQFDLSAKF